jgi:23S rRNA (uracil1939-C5)-methyltransferase
MTEQNIMDVKVDRWAYGGEAMGRLPDGKAVFVPFAVPGETLRVNVVEEKRGYARADLIKVLQPAPSRIQPRCKHFMECGGCHYQHLSYADQLAAKEEVLKDQLIRIGKFDETELATLLKPIISGESPWNYRNHVQFHLDADGRLGFQAPRSNRVVPIDECHLPDEAINQIWPRLEVAPIPDLYQVGLRSGDEDELLLVLETDSDEGVDIELDLPIAAVQVGPESMHLLSDQPYFEITADGYTFKVSAGSFFQVNTPVAEKMVAHLLENLPLQPDSLVMDIYCGVGLFSAFIAPEVGRLIGIEENPIAVEDFAVNLDAFDNVEIYEAPAEDVLPGLDMQPDIIVVDPPRAGLATEVLDAIVEIKPAVLAYISCDPSTLARDAKRLRAAGFTLQQITPFDLFPQTYHIETISFWQAD